ncbi:MAG TPA: glycosyltransferase family 9 protein [Bacteroidia bacterium]|nr:glycosyltransferase family 9 protein [Bacteroidia bacterium]
MKKILIIQTAFLGDAILATALAETLHKNAENEISILVRKGNESLFKGHPFLKEVMVWDKKNNKLNNLLAIINQVRNKKYDAVINLQRFFSTGLITGFSGAAARIGFDKNPLSFLFTRTVKHLIGDGRHEVARNLELIGQDASLPLQRPVLYPQPSDLEAIAQCRHVPYVCMAPASVWFTKQLPTEKWVELIKKIPQQIAVYLIGGPGDKTLCENIKELSGRKQVFNLAGTTGYLATAALMREAKMNFVNDSGPLHIASAVNAPVTAFFCSTLPAFGFGPLSDSSVIIETSEKLVCRPCGLHGKNSCPLGHFHCGTTIQIPSVEYLS